MAKQGKCLRCSIRYRWKKDIPLKLLQCEVCGGPLVYTPHRCKLFKELDDSAVSELMENSRDTESRPLIWLQDNEAEGIAVCGCKLVAHYNNSGPAFFPCSEHAVKT